MCQALRDPISIALCDPISIAEPGIPGSYEHSRARLSARDLRWRRYEILCLLLVEVEAGCDTGLILVIIHTHLVENV